MNFYIFSIECQKIELINKKGHQLAEIYEANASIQELPTFNGNHQATGPLRQATDSDRLWDHPGRVQGWESVCQGGFRNFTERHQLTVRK